MQVNVEDVAELKKFLPIEESFSPPYGRLVCLQVRTIAKERQRENAEIVQFRLQPGYYLPLGLPA
jgi:hypothetical protein